MSRMMIDLWTNFATFRHPTPKFKPSQEESERAKFLTDLTPMTWKAVGKAEKAGLPPYVQLDDARIMQGFEPRFEERMTLWREKVWPEIVWGNPKD